MQFIALKQFGAERTGTNVLTVLCTRAFGFKPWTNHLGSKHKVRSAKFPQNTGFLVSIRDPYAWILSYHRWLVRWCNRQSEVVIADTRKHCISWNKRYSDWMQIEPKVVVRHEDILVDTSAVIGQIAERFELRIQGQVQQIDTVVMPHEVVTKKQFNREYYLKRQYLADMSEEMRKTVANTIDWDLIGEYYSKERM